MKRPALILIFVSMLPVFAGAQSDQSVGNLDQWVNYLDEKHYEVAAAAVAQVQAGLKEWRKAKAAHIDVLEAIYVDARRENWTAEQYGARLKSDVRAVAASRESDALARIRSGMDLLREIVRQQPPPPTSRFSASAGEWLRAVSGAIGADTAAVEELVTRIEDAGQGADDASARVFVARVGIPIPSGFEDSAAQDQLYELAEGWFLFFLCASDDAVRAELLSGLSAAVQPISAELAASVTELSLSYRVAGARIARLQRVVEDSQVVLRAATLISLASERESARGDVVTETDRSRADAVLALSRLFSVTGGSGRDDLAAAAITRGAVHFALETAGRLLGTLSDRQILRLEMTLGVEIGTVRLIAGRLHRFRMDMAAEAAAAAVTAADDATDRYRRSPESRGQANLLAAHKADARAFVSSLEPWVTGRQPRTGDSYKWAMLSVVSNRYAQHLILADPELADHQRLVAEFLSSVYDGVFRRLSAATVERLGRDSAPDAPDSFDRTYRLVVEESSRVTFGPIYHAFVTEAQGEGLLSENYSNTSAAERILATEWAHMHGFHVYQEMAEEPPRRFSGVTLAWFTLAAGEQNEVQAFAHALRGTLALQSTLEYLIRPVLRDAGRPNLQLYDPRLAEARSRLSGVTAFEVAPGEIMAALTALYPEAKDVEELVDAIALSVETVEARLRDLDIPDRRAMLQAAGGAR